MIHSPDRWWCLTHRRFAAGERGCEPTQGGILLACDAVSLDKPKQLVGQMSERDLIGLVMMLTGGTANPALVQSQIAKWKARAHV